MNCFVPKIGKINLTPTDFIAKGGQASVYKHSNFAIKIYHNKSHMIPSQKLAELEQIPVSNVLKPIDIVYDDQKRAIGYIMDYIANSIPLCKLFTRSFKDRNGITPIDIIKLITEMQKTVNIIHNNKCIIVDLNEFNINVTNNYKTPIFLDVDSYQTRSFPANAIMESIRDPKVIGNNFTIESDWYSFSIIIFQMYIGAHPFKGRHPDYAKKDWRGRMDNGISVLDKNATLPPACNDLSVIPQRHMDWFKDLYINGNRCIPPTLDGKDPIIVPSKAIRIIRKSDSFDITEVLKARSKIIDVFTDFAQTYLLTNNGIEFNNRIIEPKPKKGSIYCLSFNSQSLFVNVTDKQLTFKGNNGSKVELTDRVMYKDNRIYSILYDSLYEHTVTALPNKTIFSKTKIATIIPAQTTIYDGVIIQQGLDKTIAYLPYAPGFIKLSVLDEVSSYRIVSAKLERNVLVIVGQKDRKYDRFIFIFDPSFMKYTVRINNDIQNIDINFTVTPADVCVMVVDDNKVELFKDNKSIKEIENPPFDSSTKLFCMLSKVCYIDGQTIYNVRTK